MSTPLVEANKSHVGRLVFTFIVLAIAVSILFYRQTIIDQINVWSYKPTAAVSALATRSGMSERGKFYFYASQPQLLPRETFNASCTTYGETSAVLGCYAMQRIYIFNINDEQLNGIKEVTAAHEMLHAGYARLSDSERVRVNALVEAESNKITDPTFKKLMAEYDKNEPGERANELHSLIGTQISSISPELETYYKNYFTDRAQVVALYKKYETVFSNLQSKQDTLSSELEQLSVQLSSEITQYNQAITQLSNDVTSFNRRAAAGEFSSQAEFNAERSRLAARQNTLATTRDGLAVTINTFNEKRQQLAAINSQAEALNRSINSTLQPLPSIGQ